MQRPVSPSRAPAGWPVWLVTDAPERVAREAEAVPAEAWPGIVEAARRHDLAAALCGRLTAAGCIDRVPQHARTALEHIHRQCRLAAMAWQRALHIVLPAFADAGIEAVPYKGAVIAFALLDDPATRSMSDLDFWIDAAQMTAARAVMEALGFERRENPERPLALHALFEGEIPYLGRRIGVPMIELHWGTFGGEWLLRTTAVDNAAIRRRLMPIELCGHAVPVLAPEDHLIQIAVHATVTHQLSQAPLRCLFDMIVVAEHAGGGIDWDAVVERARAWRVANAVGHALALAGALFERPQLIAVAERLAGLRRLRGLYRYADPASVLAYARLDRSLRRWAYLLALADRRRDRARLIGRSVWPEPAWLSARYGRSGAAVRIAHTAGALRGRF